MNRGSCCSGSSMTFPRDLDSTVDLQARTVGSEECECELVRYIQVMKWFVCVVTDE